MHNGKTIVPYGREMRPTGWKKKPPGTKIRPVERHTGPPEGQAEPVPLVINSFNRQFKGKQIYTIYNICKYPPLYTFESILKIIFVILVNSHENLPSTFILKLCNYQGININIDP